jgi:hypothetical protein
MPPYTAPRFQINGFNCPLCTAFAKQTWQQMFRHVPQGQFPVPNLTIGICDHCGNFSIWLGQEMVYPDTSVAPYPNPDLPPEVKSDYDEARAILSRSPRGAAALLRLAVQKFCKHLGEKGDNINQDIGELVKKGLPVGVQQALDAVRVIGNNAVHPGQIDITDDPETAARLFELINVVCDYMVTQPKRVKEIYDKIPAAQKEAINKRDA